VVAYDSVRPYEPETVLRALNALLPEDLRVVRAEEVPPRFHPRYWARERHYKYLMWLSGEAKSLARRYFLIVDRSLDVVSMDLAARMLVGTADFAAFAGKGRGVTPGKEHRGSTVRTVFDARVRFVAKLLAWPVLEFSIAANSYLPHMVRNVVGTLLKVGLRQMTVEQFATVLRSGDRSLAGPTAPPHALYLTKVVY
jgi:tRNA pseudouridine38-40 synthase